MPDELESWADVLEDQVRGLRHVTRVRVVRETGSTQDAARSAAGGVPGLLLTAGVQSAGRGQQGRVWEQGAGRGLAVTYAVEASQSGRLSMAAALAALSACERCVGEGVGGALWIKAPNDIVLADAGAASGRRKLAGILIEQGGGLALIGVGINVAHMPEHFPPGLRDSAVSLRMLGSRVSRLEALVVLTHALERWLEASSESLAREWGERVTGAGRGRE